MIKLISKEEQQIRAIFGGRFVENKPIPFPDIRKKYNYSNLFYWAHLEAIETAEFPLHPHEGFEIMTFVLEGTVEHFDTKTNVWTKIQKDGFQVIQSGSGVYHGERITKDSRVFQIWFDPDFSKTLKEEPSYKDYPSDFIIPKKDNKRTIYEYIGDSKVEHKTSNIKITKEIFLAGTYNIQINKDYMYSIYTISGLGLINSKIVKDNDFIKCEDLEYLTIDAQNNLELFIVKTPKKLKYRTM